MKKKTKQNNNNNKNKNNKNSKKKKRLENLIYPDISDSQAVLLRGI